MIDYRAIRAQIRRAAVRYTIREIGYDPRNAELLCNQQLGLEDGFEAVDVRQTMAGLGPAASEFEKLLQAGRLPSKKQSTAPPRIDGLVAAIIGLSRAMFREVPKPSVYETREPYVF